MDQSPFQYKDHTIVSIFDKEKAIQLFDALTQDNYTLTHNFRSKSKDIVQKVKVDGFDEMIFKSPLHRYKRTWERVLTLFRGSEAMRNYDSMKQLQQLGLKGTRPMLAAHRRRYGVVIECFFTYSYVEGREANEQDIPKVLELMKTLHDQGYTRSDPKLRNFIVNGDDVYFIDFRLKHPRLFTKARCLLNLCKFYQTLPDPTLYMEESLKRSWFFKLMYRMQAFKMSTRTMRKKVKKKLTH